MKTQYRRRPLAAATAMFLMALSAPVAAQSVWTGAQDDNWFNAGNWQDGAVPSAADEVRINNGAHAPVIESDAEGADINIGTAIGDPASLTIRNGGKLNSASASIGSRSSGIVEISGPGSAWTNAGPLNVGSGDSGILNISNQAVVTSDVASIGGRGNGSVSINGNGSILNVGGEIRIGAFNGSGAMIVANGGLVTSNAGIIGGENSIGSVVVNGENSRWRNEGSLFVGSLGEGQLTIEDHGLVEAVYVDIGLESGSTGNVAIDAGTLRVLGSGDLRVGIDGDGALGVLNKGKVEAANVYVGTGEGASGRIYVKGAESVLSSSDTLLVGAAGSGSIQIKDQGLVESVDAYVGSASSSTGKATIDGVGSLWSISQGLIVGDAGSGLVEILNGGKMTVDYAHITTTGSSATINVNGAGSSLIASRKVAVGYNVDGKGTLQISNGGKVESQYGYVGENYGSGVATITGPGSTWSSAVNLSVGDLGEGVLNILSGGVATAQTGIIGNESNSVGKVVIDGENSLLETDLGLNVGNSGQGSLEIRNGGRASSQYGLLASSADAEGTVSIDGAGSEWYVARTLLLGVEGAGAISVTRGARMTVSDSMIGVNAGSTGNVIVDGAGSEWYQGGQAFIGSQGDGALSVLNGGSFEALKASVGEAGGTGRILVDGANSIVDIDDSLSIYQGSLEIRNGSSAKASYGLIEGLSTAVVDGVGSTFAINTQIDNNGVLTLSKGGTVSAEKMVLADYADQHGRLNIGAGEGEAAKAAGILDIGEIKLGDGAGTILFNHTGNVDGSDYVFSTNVIAGAGTSALIQAGPGTTVLTGNNTYAGATAIDAGTLRVNGSIASSSLTTVKAGATLGGNGTVGNTTVQGTLAPGNSIGKLTVQGNLTQTSGSTYAAELGPDNSSDQVHVTGQATVESGATLRLLGQAIAGSRYTVLTADGGLTGTYQLQDGGALSRFMSMKAAYDGTHAYLDISQVREFSAAARTRNQIATAAGLDRLSDGASLHTLIANMQSDDAARDAYDQLSGEAYASVRGALLEESRDLRDAIGERSKPGDGSFWVQGLGAWGHARGDGNAARVESDRSGLLLGADWAIGDTGYVGAAAGYGKSSFDVSERGSDSDADSLHVGVYGGMSNDRFGLQAGLGYSQHDLDTRRKVGFAGFNDDLNAGFDARTAQAFVRGEVAITPVVRGFAEAAQVQVKSDGFQERGGQAALRVDDGDTKASYATVGLKLNLPANDSGLHLRGSFGWRHRFGGEDAASSTHHFGNGGAFTVYAPQMKRGSFVGEVGLAWALGKTSQLSLDYAGSAGGGAADGSVQARYALEF